MIEIYTASVKNVRELKQNRKKISQLLNLAIKHNSKNLYPTLSKTYALLYSAYAETCFLKVIHTPYGFSEDYITQISKKRNLSEQWLKCVELAFARIERMNNKGDVMNKRKKVNDLIDQYIIQPSQLRNKIAHGQWKIALNSENSAVNQATSNKIESLDFVKIDVLFLIYDKISQVIEDLIESPEKTHFRDFYTHLTELENLIQKTKGWNLESKIEILSSKFGSQQSASI